MKDFDFLQRGASVSNNSNDQPIRSFNTNDIDAQKNADHQNWADEGGFEGAVMAGLAGQCREG